MNEQDLAANDFHDPECSCCKHGAGEVIAWEIEALSKHGWYGHFVFNDKRFAQNWNVHTHGLPESVGHPDLQLTVSLPASVCNGILFAAIKQIKDGIVFEEGKTYSDVLVDYDVGVMKATECGREVVRLILPEMDGSLDPDMMPQFGFQWDDPNT